MENNLEKKLSGKKKRGIILGIILAIAIGVGIWQVLDNSTKSLSVEKGEEPVEVSMEIRIDTLAEDISQLKNDEKKEYVPKNGTILKESKYEIGKGSTAFDLLKEVTKEEDIHAEYSYSSMYKIYFIDAINHIYSMEAGDMSGWMFYVNGEMAQVGASDYKLKDGDKILWAYTCNGGEDIKID